MTIDRFNLAAGALIVVTLAAYTLAAINDALVSSRPISHQVDGSYCGGERR